MAWLGFENYVIGCIWFEFRKWNAFLSFSNEEVATHEGHDHRNRHALKPWKWNGYSILYGKVLRIKM